MKNRPSKDEYFMDMASVVSRRSTCIRRQIGALLVSGDGHILATGYNGAPKGMRHCLGNVCMRDEMDISSGQRQEFCRAVHAEQNALLQAASHGASLVGASLYCTVFPCVICAKMLINAGVVRVVYTEHYPDELAAKMLAEANVQVDLWV
jgi:dCMP deaminase